MTYSSFSLLRNGEDQCDNDDDTGRPTFALRSAPIRQIEPFRVSQTDSGDDKADPASGRRGWLPSLSECDRAHRRGVFGARTIAHRSPRGAGFSFGCGPVALVVG